MRTILASGLLPAGSLQFVAGDITPIFSMLDEQDSLAFTGSAATAQITPHDPAVLERACAFPPRPTHSTPPSSRHRPGPTRRVRAFCDAVVGEMVAKAGQKCTAIRRVIVPDTHLDTVSDALVARLEAITVGHPADDATDMGALVGLEQRADVHAAVAGGGPHGVRTELSGLDTERGVHGADTVAADDPASSPAHVVEPFGPVSTLLGYQDLDGAVALVAKGRGSLVASVSGPTPTRPRGSPSGSHRSTAGSTPSTQHPPLRRRPWFTASATCSRRARSSGWRRRTRWRSIGASSHAAHRGAGLA